MATKTKLERLRQELITKYGDPVVYISYDYYKRILLQPVEGMSGRYEYTKDPCVVEEIHLSQLPVEAIPNTATFKRLEDMIKHHQHGERGVLVEESKQEYDSDTQKEYRKRMHDDFQTFMGSQFMNETINNYHKIGDGLPSHQGDVKDYGRAMINKNHNKR